MYRRKKKPVPKKVVLTEEDDDKAQKELKDANPAICQGLARTIAKVQKILLTMRRGKPDDVVPIGYDEICRFWHAFGVNHNTIVGSTKGASVCELAWITRMSVISYQYRRDKRECPELKTSKIVELRSHLRPSRYFAKMKTREQVITAEVAAFRYIMRGRSETSETFDVAVDQKQPVRFDRLLLRDYNDVFFWLHYVHNLFERFPLKKQFELVTQSMMDKLKHFTSCRLRDKAGNSFETPARESIIDHHLPLGASMRFQSRNPKVGDHFTNLEVLNSCYDVKDVTATRLQSALVATNIGTEFHPPEMMSSTEDIWHLHAYALFIKGHTGINFLADYCVLWHQLGTLAGEALLNKEKRQDSRPRLPIFIGIGYGAYFVQDNGHINQGAEKLSVFSALCLWHSLTFSNYGGKFENGLPVPDFTTSKAKATETDRLLRISKQLAKFKKGTAFTVELLPEAEEGQTPMMESKLRGPIKPTNSIEVLKPAGEMDTKHTETKQRKSESTKHAEAKQQKSDTGKQRIEEEDKRPVSATSLRTDWSSPAPPPERKTPSALSKLPKTIPKKR